MYRNFKVVFVARVLSPAGGGRGWKSPALSRPHLSPTPIGEGIGATNKSFYFARQNNLIYLCNLQRFALPLIPFRRGTGGIGVKFSNVCIKVAQASSLHEANKRKLAGWKPALQIYTLGRVQVCNLNLVV